MLDTLNDRELILTVIETENQSSRPSWFIVSNPRVLRLTELKIAPLRLYGFETSYLTVTGATDDVWEEISEEIFRTEGRDNTRYVKTIAQLEAHIMKE
jgi:hypothetical protein